MFYSLMIEHICFHLLLLESKSVLLWGPSVMKASVCLMDSSLWQAGVQQGRGQNELWLTAIWLKNKKYLIFQVLFLHHCLNCSVISNQHDKIFPVPTGSIHPLSLIYKLLILCTVLEAGASLGRGWTSCRVASSSLVCHYVTNSHNLNVSGLREEEHLKKTQATSSLE